MFWTYCDCQVGDVSGCDMQQSWMRRSRVPGSWLLSVAPSHKLPIILRRNPFPSVSLWRSARWTGCTQWMWWLDSRQSSGIKCWAPELRYTKPSWCVDATHSCFTWPTLKKKMQPLWAIKMSESNCEGGWTSDHKIKATEMMSHKFLKSTVKTSKNEPEPRCLWNSAACQEDTEIHRLPAAFTWS